MVPDGRLRLYHVPKLRRVPSASLPPGRPRTVVFFHSLCSNFSRGPNHSISFWTISISATYVTLSPPQSLSHLWLCLCLSRCLIFDPVPTSILPYLWLSLSHSHRLIVTLSLPQSPHHPLLCLCHGHCLNSNSVSTSDHCLVHMWLCLGLGHCLVCDSVYATVTAWAVTLSLPQSLPHMGPCLWLSHRLIYDSVTASSVTLSLSQSLPHLWLCLCPRRCTNCDSVSPAVHRQNVEVTNTESTKRRTTKRKLPNDKMSNDTKCRTDKMSNGTKRRIDIMSKVIKAEWDIMSNGTKCWIEIISNGTRCQIEIMSNGTKRQRTKCQLDGVIYFFE
jgi:hypothetical protein